MLISAVHKDESTYITLGCTVTCYYSLLCQAQCALCCEPVFSENISVVLFYNAPQCGEWSGVECTSIKGLSLRREHIGHKYVQRWCHKQHHIFCQCCPQQLIIWSQRRLFVDSLSVDSQQSLRITNICDAGENNLKTKWIWFHQKAFNWKWARTCKECSAQVF